MKTIEPLLIAPQVFGDERGYFFEPYNAKRFLEKCDIQTSFVQDNESLSKRGVLRGLHYQLEPHAQAKLVRVVTGSVLDICVDIRKSSPHFKKVYAFTLDDKKKDLLFVPRGFAHGFVVLSESAIFQYKVDNYWSKEHERGILYNDPTLKIDWMLDPSTLLISDKDKILPRFDAATYFD